MDEQILAPPVECFPARGAYEASFAESFAARSALGERALREFDFGRSRNAAHDRAAGTPSGFSTGAGGLTGRNPARAALGDGRAAARRTDGFAPGFEHHLTVPLKGIAPCGGPQEGRSIRSVPSSCRVSRAEVMVQFEPLPVAHAPAMDAQRAAAAITVEQRAAESRRRREADAG
jgi:hypothetical protein